MALDFPPPPDPPTAPRQRLRRERGLLLLFALLLGMALAWDRLDLRQVLVEQERARLEEKARDIERGLAGQLGGAYAALLSVREGLEPGSARASPQRVGQHLAELGQAIPGIEALVLLGAQGEVEAASAPQWPGREASRRAFFLRAAQRVAAGRLVVEAPVDPLEGEAGLLLAIALPDDRGGVGGLLTARLAPAQLQLPLAAALDSPGMWAAVLLETGVAVAATQGVPLPEPAQRSLLLGALGDGGTETALVPESGAGVGQVALRRIRTTGLPLDQPLVIAVGRSLVPVLARWQQQTALLAALLAGLAVAAWVALLRGQRRRAVIERMSSEAQRRLVIDTERLKLALHGADLALWDADLLRGQGTVNERWHSMLGHAAGEIGADEATWRSLLHPEDAARAVATRQDHIEGRSPTYEQTYRLRHRAGHWVWVLDRGRVVERDAAGRALRMVGTHMDISDRMRDEERLRGSEQSLATTLHSIADAVIATDPQGRITRLNAAAERMTGWSAAESLGQPLATRLRLMDAATRVPTPDPVAQVLARGAVVGGAQEALLIARDGSELQITDTAAPIRGASGAIEGVVLVISDVGERLRMVQALSQREAQLSAVTAALPGPVAQLDADARMLFVNPACERWFGRPAADLLGRPLAALLGAEAQARIGQALLHVQAGNTVTFDLVLDTAEGARDAMVTLVPDGHVAAPAQRQGCFIVAADITERKRAEEELRRTEARLRVAGRVARLGGWVFERAGTRLHFSGELRAMLELEPGQEVDTSLAINLVAPEHRVRWRARLVQSMRDGQDFDEEVDTITASGRRLHVRMIGEAVRGTGGRVTALQGALQDVTERKLADTAMRVVQVDLAATLDAIPDLLFDVDSDGRIHGYHSPRDDLLFAQPQQFIGRLLDEVVPQETAAVVRTAIVQAWIEGHSSGLQYELDLPGGRRSFELSVAPKPTPQGGAGRFIVLARDVTERRQAEAERRGLERQLREAQKMESIGTLAGGIAHDFNNILAGILGNVALAQGDVPETHPVRASLEQINKAALRARILVQQILAFSRRDPRPRVVQALRPVVDETLALLRATLPASVRLDTVLAADNLLVDGDATQLQQVLMNLCTNAWHALPDGRGLIEVGVEALAGAPPGAVALRDMAPGPLLRLWVRDTGCGMDAATCERIFDPFFTTKPVGQGTGLGLSVVHGIVSSHRGVIAVDSAPGRGSTFHVYLPRAEGLPAAGTPASGAPVAPRAGIGQELLYVDDDEVMVLMVQRLLRREGYRVAVCADAREALALANTQPARFDLVVSDYNMPETSGLELAAHLLRLQPGLPIIISSGYVSDELREQSAALGVRALLAKEHTLDQLPALVARVLAGVTESA